MLKDKLRSKTLCLLSAWMAVFHLAAQGFSPGAVLCLQADGQMAVEIPGAGQGCAGQTVPQHHRTPAAISMVLLVSDGDCGPCADLLLPDASAAEGPAGRHFTTGHLSALTWQHPAPILLEPVRTSGAALHRPPPNILPPAHLHHSTVLLI
ncbi:MAG: hypothetical protein IT369_08690 [Candidatus Latescibacteria bacterium]|nr:hypothetical protein [Candidatus Latescibacterota bacterium]